ncbi:hypothetical protein L6164_023233 [Bauhinia variegata]|uniref:Uncharacterized protein n=1 Tax=Bauhinia variegata TaxID=167791 RepID=A0ACB9MJH1_BAUVA|nr:hypothetical protein L6164_023233 [Bauhinia variegata]
MRRRRNIHTTGHAGRIRFSSFRWPRFLRRQLGRRLQPPSYGGSRGASSTNCTTTGCVVDVNSACPPELVVKSVDGVVVGCNSACRVFKSPQYCCTGNYTSGICGSTSYSQIFKTACPRAYSYALDYQTSALTCSSADYNITFCPTAIASTQPLQSGFSLLTNSILVQ